MFEHILHHLNFSWYWPDSRDTLPVVYNYWLVLMSYIIALLAGYTGFSSCQIVKTKIILNHSSSSRLILVGSLAMGIGIWAMHFIAMLAFSIGEPINYDVTITIISILPAFISSYSTLKVITLNNVNNVNRVYYGIIVGLGIGVMHYTGMAAMYHDAISTYHIGLLLTSVILAGILGVITLNIWLSKYLNERLSTSIASWITASLWALTVCSMHYIGMFAVSYTPGVGSEVTRGIPSEILEWPISIFSFLIIVSSITFISIQKRFSNLSADAIRSKEQLFEAVNEMTDGFLMSVQNDVSNMINKQVYEIFIDAKPLKFTSITELFDWIFDTKLDGSLEKAEREHFRKLIHSNITLNDPIELRLVDGRWIQVRQSSTQSGTTIRILSDISEKKSAEETVIEREKMASLSRMVAGVAHEVNTPLGICVSLSSQIEEDTKIVTRAYKADQITHEQLEEYLSQMSQISEMLLCNTQRAASLVSSFKQVAVDQTILEVEPILLKSYIEKILLALKSEYKHINPKITVDCDEKLIIQTVPGALSQVILNLVTNSCLHAFNDIQEPRLTFQVTLLDGSSNTLLIAYSDNGVGMEKETLDKIFEPFFTTNRHNGGTGLGMHITFNLITQKLKGHIAIDSKQGHGSQFDITLPVMLENG